ncbi:MAG TPA: endonuclease V, partial [Rubricoccaceae bacterium]
DLGEDKGSTAPLVHGGETVGMAVRTRSRVLPVFVSVGHRCTLADAVALALRTTGRFKIPEPTRLAHALSYRQDDTGRAGSVS